MMLVGSFLKANPRTNLNIYNSEDELTKSTKSETGFLLLDLHLYLPSHQPHKQPIWQPVETRTDSQTE